MRTLPALPGVVDVGDVDDPVTFRLTRSGTGRWRVHQVSVPSGDPALVPWSVPGGAS
jgi:hypothetical protein